MALTVLKWAFYLLFAITPLVFTSFNSELFEYNKMMFVYALTTVITGVWIMRMVSTRSLILKRTPLDLPLALFLISQILSTSFSIDQHTSIWGYYSRSNGGLLSIISYILLFYAFVSNFAKEDIIKFIKALVISGVLVSLYAIPEHFGVSPSCIILNYEFTASCWVQEVQARVFGTLGQPNWLAAYLAMTIFPALYLFLSSTTTKPRIIYLLSLLVMYLAFTFTYSRGATLGLIGGFVIFGLAISVRVNFLGIGSLLNIKRSSEEHKTISNLYKQYLKLLIILLLIFVGINIYFGSALTQFRLERSLIPTRPSLIESQTPPPAGTQLENGGTESGQIRLIVWKGALEIFRAYPIFGSGVETFAYSYYQFRPNAHNLVSEWDFLYNKAHNEYLNYLATTGAVGFISYLAIILFFIVFSIKYLVLSKKNHIPDTRYQILIASILAGYISYLIQNFFLFSVVAIAVLFYLYPALAFVYTENTRDWSDKNWLALNVNRLFNLIGKKSIPRRIVYILIAIVVFLILNRLYSLWEADTLYKRGSDYNDLGNPGRAYNYLIEAVRLNPSEPLYLSDLGLAAASSALALSSEDATTSSELKNDAIFFTDLATSISPSNSTILRTAIRTFFQLTLLDPSLEEKTIEIVDRSITLAPTDPKLLVNKAVILTQLNKQSKAIESLEKAISLKPNYLEARHSLADLYSKNNQKQKAIEQYEAILKLTPGDPEIIKLLEEARK